MTVIEASKYNFSYPGMDENTLDDISFEISSGEVIGIVGALGAGKTTLCMSIAGFTPKIVGGDAEGKIDFPNQNEDTVGMVFEDYSAQLVQLKVLDEVTTPLLNRGVDEAEIENRGRELLKKVGLEGKKIERQKIWELSGGQQQQLAIAATLAIEPQILILDEVVDKLDPLGRKNVREAIAELSGEKTLIIVSHDAKFLLETVDRLLVIEDGKIIADDKPAAILGDRDLLERADIEPTLSWQIADGIDLSELVLTEDELVQKIGNCPVPFPTHIPEKTESNSKGQALIDLQKVNFAYSEDTRTLLDVSLSVREGEVHGIIGRSGAGKTTIVKHLSGLVEPNSGRVIIDGSPASDRSVVDLALTVGTVLQNPDEQISEATVEEEIGFPLKQRKREAGEIKSRVNEVCELVGIDRQLRERDPILLSRGQRKLVTIASALVCDPKILLLDEPAIGLGASARQKLEELIEKLKQQRKAVFIVSNDIDFISTVADTITLLEQGRVVLQDSVHNFFSNRHWEQLEELYLTPPRAAKIAHRLGLKAVNTKELIQKLTQIPQEV